MSNAQWTPPLIRPMNIPVHYITGLIESTTTLYGDREIHPCQRFAVHDEACLVVEVTYL